MVLTYHLCFLVSFALIMPSSITLSLNPYDPSPLPNGQPLHQVLFSQNFHLISPLLEKAQQLEIYGLSLSQGSLLNILRSPMQQLRALSFNHQFDFFAMATTTKQLMQSLTPRLFEAIFRSQYFPNLQILDLANTNLDDRGLSFLQSEKSILRTLKLDNCTLGKEGFHYLTRLDIQGTLQYLSITNTLLIEEESVEKLIYFICGQEDQCKNSLKYLDISSTGITREGFKRLIRRIDRSRLSMFKMNSLSLQYGVAYEDGFDYSAYQTLVSCSFPSLMGLQMASNDLDAEIISLFKNWFILFLVYLNVADNFLEDQQIKSWIHFQNMPLLRILNLWGNNITDQSIFHLSNQNFQFLDLRVGSKGITNQGLHLISNLQTSSLEGLQLDSMSIRGSALRFFLAELDAPLERLILRSHIQIGLLFKYNWWRKMHKLRFLMISQCDLSQSYPYILSYEGVLLPKLEILFLQWTFKDLGVMQKLVEKLPELFPSLKAAVFRQIFVKALNFSEINISAYTAGFRLDLGYVEVEFGESDKIEVLALSNIGWLARYSCSIDLSQYFSPIAGTIQRNTLDIIPQNITSLIVNELNAIFSFRKIRIFQANNTKEANIFFELIKIQQPFILDNLYRLRLPYPTDLESLLFLFSSIELPSLKELILILYAPTARNRMLLERYFLPFLKNSNRLEILALSMNSTDKNMIKTILETINSPFLRGLSLTNLQLNLQDLRDVLALHAGTIRFLDLSGNFLQKKFFELLAKYSFTLTSLQISSIYFSSFEFADMATIHTQFVENLVMENIDLTSEYLIQLVKRKKQGPLFPRLMNLGLRGNDVRREGLEALLSTGLPKLAALDIQQNNNPDIINILLSYPNGMNSLIVGDIDVSSLEPSINPKSTRKLRTIQLMTSSFSPQDYKILNYLKFPRLSFLQFYLKEVRECDTLLDLFNIAKDVEHVYLIFQNKDSGLNSSCLRNLKIPTKTDMLVINDNSMNSYMPQFARCLLDTTRQIRILNLMNLRLPQQVLLESLMSVGLKSVRFQA